MSSTSRSKGPAGAAARQGTNRLVVVLVGVALLAFVGVVAFLSAGEGADLPTLADVAGEVTVEGEAITIPFPEGQGVADPAVGLPSPVVTALDGEDRPVTVGAPGRPTVLVFLAHWCPVCAQELPTLRDIVRADGVPDGVDLVLVTTGLDPGRPNWPPQRWLEDAGLDEVLTLRDDASDSFMGAFGLRAYPAWAVIDAEGNIAARHQGLLPPVAVAQLMDLATG